MSHLVTGLLPGGVVGAQQPKERAEVDFQSLFIATMICTKSSSVTLHYLAKYHSSAHQGHMQAYSPDC